MSASIDERVVAMKFNNAQFEKGVADSNKSIADLKKNLNFDGARKSLGDLDAAGKSFNISSIGAGVDNIAAKFSALSVIGIAALATLATKAVDVGLQIGKSLFIDPAKSGFNEYELQINAIQTILANTQSKGTTLDQVNTALEELNTYADQTIYNFASMTQAIGTFTVAGVGLTEATAAVKGFSNVAALSGANATSAAGAMRQLALGISSGTIRLQDWMSIETAGIAGEGFQEALKTTARMHGVAVDDMIEKNGSFRLSLQEDWLTAEIMTQTLSAMTGDLSEAQLVQMGYSAEQAKQLYDMAMAAKASATEVKTFTQLMDTLGEATGSGWAKTWAILVGDFGEAKSLFTEVSNVLGGLIQSSADSRNQMLQDWKDLGGRTVIVDAIRNAFSALMAVFKPISEAFKEIFPPTTGQQLYDISVKIRDFTAALMPNEAAIANIKSTAKGFFAVLDIGWMIIQQVVGVIMRLFGAFDTGGEGILGVTGNIGDFLVKVRDAIKNGEGLTKFFDVLGDAIEKVVNWVRDLGKATVDAVAVDSWAEAWQKVVDALKAVGKFLQPAWDFLKEFFANAKKVVGDFFKTMDFNVLIGLLNVGALAGIGLVLKGFFDKILGLVKGGPGGIVDTIKSVFTAVTDTFKAMQANLKASALQKIAIAIAILTAAVIALSFIDTDKLFIALGAMGIMMAGLQGMLVAMDKMVKTLKPGQIVTLSGALILMATAMLILSTAILIMGNMDWDELAKGLIGMAGGMGAMLGMVKLMGKDIPKLAGMGVGMILVATAIVILASAMKIFATLSWEDVAKGGVVIVGLLAVLAVFSKSMGGIKDIGVSSLGLLAMAGALAILSGAMKVFASLSWEEIAKGLVAMAGGLFIITLAMLAMPGDARLILAAAGLFIISSAIVVLAGALKLLGLMSWEEIGKSLVVLAGSLAILAGAMALMGIPLVLLGAVGLTAAAFALMLLAPALALLGTMSWDAIGRGLTMLGASLAILAVGGLLMIPASVGFLLLGAAILMIGTGAALAGTGMLMMAAGFVALAAAGALGAEALKLAIMTVIDLIPMAMAAFAQGIIDFALVIAGGATEFTAAMTTLITSLLMAIQTNGPLVIETIWILIEALVNKIVEGVPFFVDAGMKLIIGVLTGIGNNIGKVIDAGANLIVEFLNGIARNLQKIIDAAINVVISFINGLAQGIRDNQSRFQSAGSSLFRAIVEGVSSAIENGGNLLRWAGQRIGNAIIEGAKNALGINSPSKVFRDYIMGSVGEGVDDGAEKQKASAYRAGAAIGNEVVAGTAKVISQIASAVATDMNFQPTVRPILDLSGFRKEASLIGGILTPPTLSVDKSYAYASSLATAQRTSTDSDDESGTSGPPDAPVGQTVILNQYNNSPKAISPAETYRNTKNALSVAKGALTP